MIERSETRRKCTYPKYRDDVGDHGAILSPNGDYVVALISHKDIGRVYRFGQLGGSAVDVRITPKGSVIVQEAQA